MDHTMDPYEQQLLTVFNSYDVTHCGSLDQEGLLQLCNSLQLEERGIELVKCLVSDSKSHVTFDEFKEGLLALLGSVQNNRQKVELNESDEIEENESPDREVSPKFVYGSKKYGRRSRPESTEQIELFDQLDTDLEKNSEVFDGDKYEENKSLINLNKVQRSNSQSDVTYSRKRKTSGKLKRCTSFPGNHEMKSWLNQDKQSSTKTIRKLQSPTVIGSDYYANMFRTTLEQLNIGIDGYLSQMEIIHVCEFMGIHKLAKDLLQQVVDKKELNDFNQKISIDEFLEVLEKEEELSVYDVIAPPVSLNNTRTCLAENFNDDSSKTLQYITLGPNGSGIVSLQTIVELWENAGITSASTFLQELGFSQTKTTNIEIIDLVTVLDEELRNLTESRTNISSSSSSSTSTLSYKNINPHILLLQASIALYQSEVKYLKSLLEQLSAERDKLRTDILDANHRATLLAQEVDDNHARMEKSTQNQVRLLEQRHSDIIKDLTSQFIGEKEHMSAVNGNLEKKIQQLEMEEAKLRADLQNLQQYNNTLEKENNLLSNQLSDIEMQRYSLTEKVNILENECQKISEIERERDQLETLLKKLSILQIENAELRDKNDELCTEVESLNCQITSMRSKISVNNNNNNISNIISSPTYHHINNIKTEENIIANICEGVGVGLGAIKRRVDSPCKDNVNINEFELEMESPRLGKVRRCYQKNQHVITSSNCENNNDNGGEILLDVLPLPLFNSNESGFEADLDYLDSSLSFNGSENSNNGGGTGTGTDMGTDTGNGNDSGAADGGDTIKNLQTRITYLEQLLMQHSIKIPVNYITNNSNNKNVDNECTGDEHIKVQLTERCMELEQILEQVQISVTDMISKKSYCNGDQCNLLNPMAQLSEKLKRIVLENSSTEERTLSSTGTIIVDQETVKINTSTETLDTYVKMKRDLDEKENKNKLLLERCDELEQALELLRSEFENCENYWSNKLDEERQLYEQDHRQSSDKLNELLIKISEYEEQYANQDIIAAGTTTTTLNGRLSPIEEKDLLEQQFNELEEEYDEFRTSMELKLEQRDKLIVSLQRQLNDNHNDNDDDDDDDNNTIGSKNYLDASIQVDLNETNLNKISNLSNVIQSTNIFSSETLPHVWQYPITILTSATTTTTTTTITPIMTMTTPTAAINNSSIQLNNHEQNSIDSVDSSVINITERDYINPNFIWNKTELLETEQQKLQQQQQQLPIIETNSDSGSSNCTAENSITSVKSDYNQLTCTSLPPNISWHSSNDMQLQQQQQQQQPHSINYVPGHVQINNNNNNNNSNNNACRPKKIRKHDRNIFTTVSQLRSQRKENNTDSEREREQQQQQIGTRWNTIGMYNNNNNNIDQTCVVPLNSIHHLYGRLRELDQHCRHLQYILKQQQRHNESVMHHCWQQHREEINDMQMQMKTLQEKLARSDMLIKDLYVENTYLMANNQRLEHRCHMLVQCNSESTSV